MCVCVWGIFRSGLTFPKFFRFMCVGFVRLNGNFNEKIVELLECIIFHVVGVGKQQVPFGRREKMKIIE